MRETYDKFEEGAIFHLYNRCVHDEKLFRVTDDYNLFLEKFNQFGQNTPATMIAYCLMPNHYHFIIRQNSEIPLYKLMNELISSYVKIYNRMYERKGRLFGNKLQSKLIKDDDYLLSLCHYVHTNPVKANIISPAELWQYSDYSDWISIDSSKKYVNEIRDEFFKDKLDYKTSSEKYLLNYFENKERTESVRTPSGI